MSRQSRSQLHQILYTRYLISFWIYTKEVQNYTHTPDIILDSNTNSTDATPIEGEKIDMAQRDIYLT